MSLRSFIIILFGTCLSTTIIGQIAGHVYGPLGAPIEGVSVFLSNGNFDITDNVGHFRFEDKESHSISFDHIGYEIQELVLASYVGDMTALHIALVEKAYKLDDVQVLGSWAEPGQAVTQSTLNKEDIEKRNLGQDVPYILQWEPSTQVYSDAGAGIGYTYLRIRGSDQERINFNINGVPLNDAESQQVFWVDLPDFTTSTKSIQIQRGLGLSAQGVGAFGASVNMSTTHVSDEPSATLSTGVGSFGTYKGSVQFESGTLGRHFHMNGRMSIIQSDGYIDRASSDLKSFYLSGDYIGTRQSLTLNAFSGSEVTYQAWNGVPINFVNDDELRTFNSAGTERPEDPHANQVDDYGQTHLQLIHKLTINNRLSSNVTFHYTKGNGFFELYQANEDLADYFIGPLQLGDTLIETSNLVERRWLDNDYYGAIVNFNYSSTDIPWSMKWGGGWNTYDGQHYGEVIWAQYSNAFGPDTRYYDNQGLKRDFNLFGQFNYNFTNTIGAFADMQYRRVSYRFLGLDESGNSVEQSVKHNFINPKVGLAYDGDKLHSYAYIGYGHKEPNRNDYTESSPLSRPLAERMLNIEAGGNRSWGVLSARGNIYFMKYTDQLVPTGQLNDVGAATRINADDSYRIGVEWELDGVISNRLSAGIGGTLSRNKISAYDFYIDSYDDGFNYLGQELIQLKDVDIAFSPSLLLNAHGRWSPMTGFDILIDAKYVGRQYLDNSQTEVASLDAHRFVNSTLSYSWTTTNDIVIKLKLLVQNIFNSKFENFGWTYPYLFQGETSGEYTRQVESQNYRDIGLYPQAGINYLLGLTVQF